ncbi:MAG: CDP-alcohol phosphatidyltransferase, partial [Lewinellaceae bacterium]|nr:CDP-alcohol phosphatidyltransferase [Lewinellaceae bacterium]
YLVAQQYFLSSLFAFIAMIGSIMVSYVRARAEGLGVECKGGLMQRPERVLLVGIAAIICGITQHYVGDFKYVIPGTDFPYFENITIFTFPIFVMAILTNWTAIQRLRESKAGLDALDSRKKYS